MTLANGKISYKWLCENRIDVYQELCKLIHSATGQDMSYINSMSVFEFFQEIHISITSTFTKILLMTNI